MPRFRITDSDGKTYRITVPEGTTKEQAYGYLQQHKLQQGGTVTGTADVRASPAGDLGIGIARGLADDAAPFVWASGMLPGGQSELGQKIVDLSLEPSGSPRQRVGRFAGAGLPFAFLPTFGLGELAARAASGPLTNFATRYGAWRAAHSLYGPLGYWIYHTLDRNGTLEQVARMAAPYAARLGHGLGTAIEKTGLFGVGGSTSFIGDNNDDKQDGQSGSAQRGAGSVSSNQPDRQKAATGTTRRRNRYDDPAADSGFDSRWPSASEFSETPGDGTR